MKIANLLLSAASVVAVVSAQNSGDSAPSSTGAGATVSTAGSSTSASAAISNAPASASGSGTQGQSSGNAAGGGDVSKVLKFVDSLKLSKDSKAKNDDYHFSPITVIQARVQSDEPSWMEDDSGNGYFVSSFGDDLKSGHVSATDNVNTASVEGALMYVQAEGINEGARDVRCERKTSMQWVVFYEYVIVQTNETIALYQDDWETPEYGKMVAMDGGACTPQGTKDGEDVYPLPCKYFNGDDGEPNVGPFVGGTLKATDVRAPYPNNYWFSFPNTCPFTKWGSEDECRKDTRAGVCPIGVMPDGIECTYNYQILGYVAIDDLVGITSMKNESTGETYKDFKEFCEAGNVEFKAPRDDFSKVEESIPFWEKPLDEEANVARFEKLVEAYKNLTSGDFTSGLIAENAPANFLPLPSVEELRKVNPPCYKNVPKCAEAANGCTRDLYSMICKVCDEKSDKCEVAEDDFKFPELERAVGSDGGSGDPDAEGANTDGSAGDGSNNGAGSDSEGGDGAAAASMSVAAALMAAAVFLN